MRGRKSGVEDESNDFLGREVRSEIFVDQSGGHCPARHGSEIDAAAVVRDVDPDRVAQPTRLDPKAPDLGFARGDPIGRLLEAVVDRVADEVEQRLRQSIEDRPVELELRALDLDLDPLPELLRDRARRARQVVGDPLEGRGPQLEDPPLQLGNAPIDPIESVGDLGFLRITRDARTKLARGEDDLADGREEAVEGLRPNADGRAPGSGRSLGGGPRLRRGFVPCRQGARSLGGGL